MYKSLQDKCNLSRLVLDVLEDLMCFLKKYLIVQGCKGKNVKKKMFGAYRQQITDDKWTGLIIELNNHVGTGLYPVTVMNEREIMGQWDIPQLLPI